MKSKKRTIGILIVVIVVLLGFAGSLLVYRNKLSSENKNNNSNNNTAQSFSSAPSGKSIENFYDKPITDEKIALDSIEVNRDKLGYSDKNFTFEFERKTEYMGASYSFKLLYKNIPVKGKGVNVITYSDNMADILMTGGVDVEKISNINTNPKITQDEALNLAKQNLGEEAFEPYNFLSEKNKVNPELIIFETENNYLIAYCIEVNFWLCIINAESGNVITSRSTLVANSAEYKGQNGDKHQIFYDDYEDKNRNIKNLIWNKEYNIFVFNNGNAITLKDIQSDNNKSAIDGMANTYEAVKYFKKHFSKEFNATRIYVNVDNQLDKNGKVEKDSATGGYEANGDMANIIFTIASNKNKSQKSAYLDIVAHEFTHSVTFSIAFTDISKNNDERDALMEAYSDIFGQLIEQESTGSTDWIQNVDCNIWEKIDVDGSTDRNLRQPKIKKYSEWENSGDVVHKNSTIISHTAYLMSKDNNSKKYDAEFLLDYNQVAQLWYGSLEYLKETEFMDFSDCRWAIEKSARKLIKEGVLIENNLKIVEQAFNEVEVISNPTRRGLTDSMEIIKDKNTIVVPIEDETQSTEFVEITEVPTEPANWQQLYADELKRYMASDKYNNESMFDLYDIDNDGIPELFIYHGGGFGSSSTIYKVYNNSLVEFIRSRYNEFSSSKQILYSYDLTAGSLIFNYSELKENNLNNKLGGHSNSALNDYCINGEDVTKEIYNNYISEFDSDDYIEVGRKYKLDEATINSVLLNSDINNISEFEDTQTEKQQDTTTVSDNEILKAVNKYLGDCLSDSGACCSTAYMASNDTNWSCPINYYEYKYSPFNYMAGSYPYYAFVDKETLKCTITAYYETVVEFELSDYLN